MILGKVACLLGICTQSTPLCGVGACHYTEGSFRVSAGVVEHVHPVKSKSPPGRRLLAQACTQYCMAKGNASEKKEVKKPKKDKKKK